jgi:hypothetical protein
MNGAGGELAVVTAGAQLQQQQQHVLQPAGHASDGEVDRYRMDAGSSVASAEGLV